MKKARDDSEKSAEARIGRLKAKHDTEIGELAKEIEEYKCKHVEIREKLLQKEGEASMLAVINKQVGNHHQGDVFIHVQMEVQMKELEEVKTKLINERNDVASVVRREFAENLDKLAEENTRLATELQNMV